MQQLMMSLFAPIHCACSILTAVFCQMAGLQTFETNALGSSHGHPPRQVCPCKLLANGTLVLTFTEWAVSKGIDCQCSN
ncbi:hypothetical protein T08_13320 [Trichinella sp. T8]|nr:hypothetical protein T08_13320 [Trichinella sp. T8]